MEVHHHSTSSGKKWTHYFWEFIMLFLAVFCGFLAENIREHKVEKDREKVYIKSMIEDLKSDTLNISGHLIFREDRRRRMDSLTLLLNLPDFSNYTGLIYYYGRWASRNPSFSLADRTISQLKNSGSMRLITSPVVSDAIMAYDYQVKFLYNQSFTLEQDVVLEYFKKMPTFFDGNVLDEMYSDTTLTKPKGNPPLLNNDKKAIKELISFLHTLKSLNKRNLYFETKLKEQAVGTIEILKKAYHLN